MSENLSTTRAAALYIGALLGPGLLLLPGLAARLAGPASLLAWIGLLGLSGLFAVVFTGFGIRIRSHGGVAAYAAAGLGDWAGRAVGWCFLSGVVVGAPVVCLIGADYVGTLIGAGARGTILIAAVLLVSIVAITLAGARASTGVQLGLIAVLVVLIAIAVVGSAPHAHATNWTPFAPHGWTAIGSAAAVLMLSFVGWEAIAPMTTRLADAPRQLPRIIAVAFAVTAIIYLALAVSTVSVLGSDAGGAVPLSDLLCSALGSSGRAIAAVAAVALVVAAVNAYVSGAVELAGELRRQPSRRRPSRWDGVAVQLAIMATGVVLMTGAAIGWVSTTAMVTVPTTLFLTVYLGCIASAVRVLRGAARAAAVVALPVVVVVLGFSGWALGVAAAVVLAASADEIRRNHRSPARNPLLMCIPAVGSVSHTPSRNYCGVSS